MDHEGKDAHLGGTAVVELDGGSTLLIEGTDGGQREVSLVLLASLLDVSLAKTKAKLQGVLGFLNLLFRFGFNSCPKMGS